MIPDTMGAAETEEEKENLKWYNGLITAITNFVSKQVPTVSSDDLLLQSKFKYRYNDVKTEYETVTTSMYDKRQIIETKDGDGKITSSTEIRYE